MPRLIWVFAGCTLILLVLSCRGSNVRIITAIFWGCLKFWYYDGKVHYTWLGFGSTSSQLCVISPRSIFLKGMCNTDGRILYNQLKINVIQLTFICIPFLSEILLPLILSHDEGLKNSISQCKSYFDRSTCKWDKMFLNSVSSQSTRDKSSIARRPEDHPKIFKR